MPNNNETHPSHAATTEHKANVRRLMLDLINDLQVRAATHDNSKLESPEVEAFDAMTSYKVYNSPEYHADLEKLKPALDHHYSVNRHHPQHYPNGIHGMTLVDLVEMLCDWKASTLRQPDADQATVLNSIKINAAWFGYGSELAQILENTAAYYFNEIPAHQSE